jgi:hypothetical protein
MAERKVQQFEPREDDFYEIGDPRMLDLTDDELSALNDGTGEPVLLERHRGFFILIEKD